MALSKPTRESRAVVNKFVSRKTALSDADDLMVSRLFILQKLKRSHGNVKCRAWQYFGHLFLKVDKPDAQTSQTDATVGVTTFAELLKTGGYRSNRLICSTGGGPRDLESGSGSSSSSTNTVPAVAADTFDLQLSDHVKTVFDTRLHCGLCLANEQKAYKDAKRVAGYKGKAGHISNIKSYGLRTSSSSLSDHLFHCHNIDCYQDREEKGSKQGTINKFIKSSEAKPAENKEQLALDLALWFCLDLLPFSTVTGRGFQIYHDKNNKVPLPSTSGISIHALDKLYKTLKVQMGEQFKDVKVGTILFDGWTDQHRAGSYLGLRFAFIKEWEYKTVTLSCKVLDGHTGENMAEHIRQELDDYQIPYRKMMLFSVHDGASNVKKADEYMKIPKDRSIHCIAHVLHLLLSSDGISKVSDLVSLLKKCKEIVTSLHFKGCLLEECSANLSDEDAMEKLMSAINKTEEVIELEERFPEYEVKSYKK